MADQQPNDAVVTALAKMVDERLAAEFEKRDKMILTLKSGMDKLVSTLRESNPSGSRAIKGGANPPLKLMPRAPSSASRASFSSSSSKKGRNGTGSATWGKRSDVPPKRKKRQMAAMMYGTKRRHPVRKGTLNNAHRPYRALPQVA